MSANFTTSARLEVLSKGGEMVQPDKALWRRGMCKLIMLEHPGVGMVHVDRVKTGGKRGIDVGARTIADHPGAFWSECMALDDLAIRIGVLLGGDFNGGEVHMNPGAVEFLLLLLRISFGDQDQTMPLGEGGECFGHAREQLDCLIDDRLREAGDALPLFTGGRRFREFGEAVEQGTLEAGHAVSVRSYGRVLAAVQYLPNLGGCVSVMIEIADESGDGAFEIDVVFPQRVVGIDQQGLGREGCRAKHLSA
jgi:hypothetical protein